MSTKRILMIVGGIWHDFEGFMAATRPLLEDAGYMVDTTYDLDTLLHLSAKGYDLVLSYTSLSKHREGQNDTTPQTLTEAQTEALTQWVREGGALLAVHSATVSGLPNPAMQSLFGGVFVSHPPQFSFPVYPMPTGHPIIADIEAFCVHDEFYVQEYDPTLEIHMVALDRGVAHPMVWTKSEGRGHVAYIAMGHDERVWSLLPYQRLLLQASAWLIA